MLRQLLNFNYHAILMISCFVWVLTFVLRIFILIIKTSILTLCNSLIWILQVEDTGRYTCLASSPAGDDDKEYLVRVHGNAGKMSCSGIHLYLIKRHNLWNPGPLFQHIIKLCLYIRKYVFCKFDFYIWLIMWSWE